MGLGKRLEGLGMRGLECTLATGPWLPDGFPLGCLTHFLLATWRTSSRLPEKLKSFGNLDDKSCNPCEFWKFDSGGNWD